MIERRAASLAAPPQSVKKRTGNKKTLHLRVLRITVVASHRPSFLRISLRGVMSKSVRNVVILLLVCAAFAGQTFCAAASDAGLQERSLVLCTAA
jgi:hypothetical protein